MVILPSFFHTIIDPISPEFLAPKRAEMPQIPCFSMFFHVFHYVFHDVHQLSLGAQGTPAACGSSSFLRSTSSATGAETLGKRRRSSMTRRAEPKVRVCSSSLAARSMLPELRFMPFQALFIHFQAVFERFRARNATKWWSFGPISSRDLGFLRLKAIEKCPPSSAESWTTASARSASPPLYCRAS